MSRLTDAVERLEAYARRTHTLPSPEVDPNFDLGLILGVMRNVLARQCVPEHDHHVMPHRGCPLR